MSQKAIDACRLMTEAFADYDSSTISDLFGDNEKFRMAQGIMEQVAAAPREPRPDPRDSFARRIADKIVQTKNAAFAADGTQAAVLRSYLAALYWVQSLGAPKPPPWEDGTVVEIFKISGGTGTIKYRRADGSDDRVYVVAEGWGDGYGDVAPWPPQVGDEIRIHSRTIVMVKNRQANRRPEA